MKEIDRSDGLKRKPYYEEKNDEIKEGEDDEQPNNGSCSNNSTVEESERRKRSTGVRQYVRSKMPRLRWTPNLHLQFVQAVQRVGGQERATPKLVLQEMNIKGLSIPHIKSHLQMYRRKKIDNRGQVIKDRGYLIESEDRKAHNPNQFHILHGFDQRLTSSFSDDASWSSQYNGNQIRSSPCIGGYPNLKVISGIFSSVPLKNFGDTDDNSTPNRKLCINNSDVNDQTSMTITCKPIDEFQLLYHRELCRTTIRPRTTEPHFITQFRSRESEEGNCMNTTDKKLMKIEEEWKMTKRRAVDFDLDLHLSLNVRSGQRDGYQSSWAEEEIDSNLSLSLFSPSKKERYSLDQNQGSKLRRLKEDDSRKNSKRACTLDLTI